MMSQAVKEKSQFSSLFEARRARVEHLLPSWVNRLSASALESFEARGFPSTDEEDWKYTNVSPLARREYALASPADAAVSRVTRENVEPFLSAEAAASRLVFVNGIYREDLSALDALHADGAVALSLAGALEGESESLVREYLARGANAGQDAFAALNTAFIEQGVFLHLPAGVQVAAPIQLLFVSTEGERERATFPRVLVVGEQGSRATVIETYVASGEASYLTNALVEIFVKDSARLSHYKVQRESLRAFHIATTYAEVARGSFYEATTITLGAELSRHAIHVRLAEEGAECRVDGLYLVNTGQHADTHSLIDHLRAHGISRQNYKGILDGRSRAVFNGRVFVHKDARQTDAVQSNKNLLLSGEARVDTKPQLEIYNDDVKCAHGATVGQLAEEELFYLKSRGLHPELARNLLTYGFAEEIVEKISIPSIKEQLDEAILKSLHARLEV